MLVAPVIIIAGCAVGPGCVEREPSNLAAYADAPVDFRPVIVGRRRSKRHMKALSFWMKLRKCHLLLKRNSCEYSQMEKYNA